MSEAVLKGRKILVVDDEDDQRMYIATVLEDNGAEVIEAGDGDQALALARSEKPSLITLDLGMPGKSGVEVFETMRHDEVLAGIPICIVTGRPELRKLIWEMVGVEKPEGYLDKPIDAENLLHGVRMVLELRDRKAHRKHA
jgi:CheY-like chemotaxis protein